MKWLTCICCGKSYPKAAMQFPNQLLCSEFCEMEFIPIDKETKFDPIQKPAHYNTGKIEVIEFIEDQKLGYNLGNAVKYISRSGKKDKAKTIEDLKKAIWYLTREVELQKLNPRRPSEMATNA